MYYFIRDQPTLMCLRNSLLILRCWFQWWSYTFFHPIVLVVHSSWYISCLTYFTYRFKTWGYFLILNMADFSIILVMTWLSRHCVVLNCNIMSVHLEVPGMEKLEREEVYKRKKIKTISFIRTSKLVIQGCLAYFCLV